MTQLLADPNEPTSLSNRLRRRRDVHLRALIQSIQSAKGAVRIIDMGGTVEYWKRVGFEFLRETNSKVTIVNLATMELSQEDIPEITSVVGDACQLSQYQDGSFDLAHSNSVIEHVVTWPNMRQFAAETRRLADYYYVQTPYFWFPIDPHYYRAPMFHWFPRPVRARLLRQFPIAYAGRIPNRDASYETVDHARLLDAEQFDVLFPDAEISFERFCGLRKSMIAVRRPVDH